MFAKGFGAQVGLLGRMMCKTMRNPMGLLYYFHEWLNLYGKLVYMYNLGVGKTLLFIVGKYIIYSNFHLITNLCRFSSVEAGPNVYTWKGPLWALTWTNYSNHFPPVGNSPYNKAVVYSKGIPPSKSSKNSGLEMVGSFAQIYLTLLDIVKFSSRF